MQKKMKTLCLFVLAITLVFSFIGCSKDKADSSSVTAPNSSALRPTGTIQGHMYDSVTNEPIVGARIDIAVGSAVTSATGEFVIYNVPANTDGLNGSVSGSYYATIDLKNVTSPVNMTSAATTPRYANYAYYDSISVEYTSLDDTEGTNAGGGGGSNHDTPVTGLVAHVDFHVGKLAANIVGVAYMADTLQNVGAGYTVKLLSDASHANSNSSTGNVDNVIATTTTGTNGDFTFSNVESLMTFEIRAQSSNGLYVNSSTYTIKAPADLQTKTMNIQSGESPTGSAFTCSAVPIGPADNVDPTVVSVSPERGTDLDLAASTTGLAVFTFSEAIKQDAYALTLSDNGVFAADSGLYSDVTVSFNGVKAGNIAYSLGWNTAGTALTVTIPNLAPSSKYSVNLAGAVGKLKDIYDNTLVSSSTISTAFTTNGGSTPQAPTGLAILNTATINYNSTSVSLDWLPIGGNKMYSVYRTKIQWPGTTSQEIGVTTRLTTTTPSQYTDAAVTDTFLEGDNVPLAYDYKVTGVNSDGLESAATATVRAADVVRPQLSATPVATADMQDGNNTITISFNEPMKESTAETAANYTITARGGFTAPAIATTNGLQYSSTPNQVVMTFTDLELAIAAGTQECGSTLLGDDVQVISNTVAVCVQNGPNGVSDSTAGGDDTACVASALNTTDGICAGPDGVCNTTAAGDDLQTTPSGRVPVCITRGTDGTINSTVGGADVALNAIQNIALGSGVTDVAGNTINTTADTIQVNAATSVTTAN